MFINVIIRDGFNQIINVKRIKYNKVEFDDLNSIAEYLKTKYNEKGQYYICEYDIECKKNYLKFKAKKEKKLDLETNFEIISFSEYYRITDNSILTINTFLGCSECGDVNALLFWGQLLFFIKDVIRFIMNFIGIILIYVFPFYNIKRKYGYGKQFISDLIKLDDVWNFKFFKLSKFKYNIILERSIMKKLGYRKKNKKWVNYSYPEIYDLLNKNDKF